MCTGVCPLEGEVAEESVWVWWLHPSSSVHLTASRFVPSCHVSVKHATQVSTLAFM